MADHNGLCGLLQKMKMPCVKYKACADVEVYANRKAKAPFAAIRIKDEHCYTLWCLLKIVGAFVLVLWLLCKSKRLLKKIV